MTSDLWDRQRGESPKAYHAFCHYRDMPQRSLDRAFHAHAATCLKAPQEPAKRRSKTWATWSARWGWVARSEAFDLYLVRQKQAALEQEQVEAGKRHARLLHAGMQAVTAALRVALDVVASPEGLLRLRALASTDTGLRAALVEARLAASHLPALISAERLVLGMSSVRLEVHETPDDPIAAAIVKDPALVALASDLLHRAAHQEGPDAASDSRRA